MNIKNTEAVNRAFTSAQHKAMQYRHEFVTPEHLLSAFMEQTPFVNALGEFCFDIHSFSLSIENYLRTEMESVPQEMEYELEISAQLNELLQHAYLMTDYSGAEELDVPHLVQGMLQLEDSLACYLLKDAVSHEIPDFISSLISDYEDAEPDGAATSSIQEQSEPWRNYVTCLNDILENHNPP